MNNKYLRLLRFKFRKHFNGIYLRGFKGASLYDVLCFFVRHLSEGAIGVRASSIAFHFFLALFPGLIFLFSLIPFIQVDGFQSTLLAALKSTIPDRGYDLIAETVRDIILTQRGSIVSLGFFMMFYFSTNGVVAMFTAFNATAHSIEKRSWLKKRLIASLLVLVNSIVLAVAIILIIWGKKLVNMIGAAMTLDNDLVFVGLWLLRWGVIIIFLYSMFSLSYYFAPAKQDKWEFTSPGSMVSTLLSMLAIGGFSFYINNFSRYNKLYGSIGAVIVIMLWFYIQSYILLLGFELNTSIKQIDKQNQQCNEEPEHS
ncbi:MAG: YihY/virulence factor BrkB family protein [Bacteroidales bacterium]